MLMLPCYHSDNENVFAVFNVLKVELELMEISVRHPVALTAGIGSAPQPRTGQSSSENRWMDGHILIFSPSHSTAVDKKLGHLRSY